MANYKDLNKDCKGEFKRLDKKGREMLLKLSVVQANFAFYILMGKGNSGSHQLAGYKKMGSDKAAAAANQVLSNMNVQDFIDYVHFCIFWL